MNIAILGFAGQGQSAYDYWNNGENSITICDRNPETHIPKGAESQLGDMYLENLDRFDLLIRTPALHPREIVNANNSQILDKIWSNTNEFFKVCPTASIIGVTGTKGKGTTSTLIAEMLKANGKTVYLGGNIGIPPLELLKNDIQPDDWVVLELANFQLIDLKTSPHIAVCLMVEPEHMDWHEDFEEYIASKQQMFIHQNENDIAVYYSKNDNSLSVADATNGQLIPYMESPGATIENNKVMIAGTEVCAVADIKLLGKHNHQNVCAAVTAAWQITQDVNAIKSVISNFAGLEHRLELVRDLNGVKYYDDSFGTTPETAIVAIEAFKEPKVIILGGSDKGSDYAKLARTVKDGNVHKIVLIGEMADKIRSELDEVGFTEYTDGGSTMPEIVDVARKAAQPGDVVLLSTGCASFGLFKDYKHRGEEFQKAVLGLS